MKADLSIVGGSGEGYTARDFLPELAGGRGARTVRRMRDNDPIIGAALFAIESLIRRTEFSAQPNPDAPSPTRAEEEAAFLTSCLDDMSHTFQGMLAEVLTMIPHGWAFMEKVYKYRRGPDQKDPANRSAHSDGRIGWRKVSLRPQESLSRWAFDGDGGVSGMYQLTERGEVFIPIEKAALFRTTEAGNNPEGRALDLGMLIPTPDGWTTIGDIQVGEKLFDEQGRIQYVVAKSQVWQQRPCFEVRFGSGHSLIVDANHEWAVTTSHDRYKERAPRILTTQAMYEASQKADQNYSAGVAPILDGQQQHMPVDPYVLGYWLGDGTVGTGAFAVSPDDYPSLGAEVERSGLTIKHDGDRKAFVPGLRTRLEAIGVLRDKHVPVAYLRAAPEQRLALLQGLMDADGTSATGKDKASKFYNSNERLVADFCELVRTLGGQPRKRVHQEPGRSGGVVNGRPVISRRRLYEVSFFLPSDAHRLTRKREAQSKKGSNRTNGHNIVSITPVAPRDTVCIEVSAASHLFLAGEGMVPTHNSMLRNAYRPWYFKTKLEEFEAIGVERDLAGLPVVEVPLDLLSASATADERALLASFEKMAAEVRRDERGYVVMPSEQFLNDEGRAVASGYRFRLLASGGSRQQNTDLIIRRYEQRIAMTLLAEFLLLGMDGKGAYALSDDKTTLFGNAIGSVVDGITATINRFLVQPLFALNGVPAEYVPTLIHGPVLQKDVAGVATAIAALASGGVLTPDDRLEAHLRQQMELPEHDPATARRHSPAPTHPPQPEEGPDRGQERK